MVKSQLVSKILPCIIVILSYFIIFKNLDVPQIRMWDEATYANNAIDMYESGDFFNVTHLGKIDWYNTKPPFAIWVQTICMKIFGIDEFAVRLPSAVFGLLTVLLIYFFCYYELSNLYIGFIASMVLLTSKGFVTNHVVLTGDLDSILVFWLTLGILAFISLISNKPKHRKILYFCLFLSLTFGFLTKGIAGFFFTPFMLLILIINNNYEILRQRGLYISIFSAMLICAAYYLIRENISPGYLMAVWNTEILRYGAEVMSWHVHPFNFYLEQMIENKFTPYIYILPFSGLLFYILRHDTKKIKLLVFLLTSATGYFLLISIPSIKLEWYEAPLYPLLSIITGITVFELFFFLSEKLNRNWSFSHKNLIIISLLAMLFFYPVRVMIESRLKTDDGIYYMEFEGAYVRYLQEKLPAIKNLTVFKQEKNIELFDQILFYKRALEKNGKMRIRITEKFEFNIGELVMVHKEEDKKYIQENFDGTFINSWKNGFIFRITGVKS